MIKLLLMVPIGVTCGIIVNIVTSSYFKITKIAKKDR